MLSNGYTFWRRDDEMISGEDARRLLETWLSRYFDLEGINISEYTVDRFGYRFKCIKRIDSLPYYLGAFRVSFDGGEISPISPSRFESVRKELEIMKRIRKKRPLEDLLKYEVQKIQADITYQDFVTTYLRKAINDLLDKQEWYLQRIKPSLRIDFSKVNAEIKNILKRQPSPEEYRTIYTLIRAYAYYEGKETISSELIKRATIFYAVLLGIFLTWCAPREAEKYPSVDNLTQEDIEMFSWKAIKSPKEVVMNIILRAVEIFGWEKASSHAFEKVESRPIEDVIIIKDYGDFGLPSYVKDIDLIARRNKQIMMKYPKSDMNQLLKRAVHYVLADAFVHIADVTPQYDTSWKDGSFEYEYEGKKRVIVYLTKAVGKAPYHFPDTEISDIKKRLSKQPIANLDGLLIIAPEFSPKYKEVLTLFSRDRINLYLLKTSVALKLAKVVRIVSMVNVNLRRRLNPIYLFRHVGIIDETDINNMIVEAVHDLYEKLEEAEKEIEKLKPLLQDFIELGVKDPYTLPPHIQTIRSIASSAKQGTIYCLFLGAGASQSATIPLGDDLKLKGLRLLFDMPQGALPYLENMFREEYSSKFKAKVVTLEMVMQAIKEKMGKDVYQRIFEELNSEKKPPEGYFDLAHIVKEGYIKIIFTVNLDELCEDAFKKILGVKGEKWDVIYESERFRDFSPIPCVDIKKPVILKLHGTFKSISSQIASWEEIKTLSSWKTGLFEYYFRYYPFIFVGYSARDPDILSFLKTNKKLRDNDRYKLYWVDVEFNDNILQLLNQYNSKECKILTKADVFFEKLRKFLSISKATQASFYEL
jgi:hypothetical protein